MLSSRLLLKQKARRQLFLYSVLDEIYYRLTDEEILAIIDDLDSRNARRLFYEVLAALQLLKSVLRC